MSADVRGWFVAGTDTGIGKTAVAEALLIALRQRGECAVGMKPVASGCRRTSAGWRSEDAERLQAAGNLPATYADINPYAFEPAIAPHVAAHRANVEIDLSVIASHYARLAAQADWIVVEGAGGWYVPVNHSRRMSDIARAIGLPVILVVGLRLGCINHALLTAAAIRADGLNLAAWIGNSIDPTFDSRDETVVALRERLAAPCAGILPYEKPAATAKYGAGLLAALS